MKYIKITMLIYAAIAFFPAILKAQLVTKVNINGLVYNSNKIPVNSAVIRSINEDNNEIKADDLGAFSITVPLNAPLTVTAPGFKTINISATKGLKEINLVADADEPEIQVAFRKVNKKDLLGGVTAVNVKQLMNKSYNTYSLEGMDALVAGYNGNSLWGMGGYLLLIDGVPREAGNVMPTEIEQVTFLKGVAAVALYGSRAAKGVVFITTKRGEENNTRIDIRANSGFNAPKSFPKYLGSAEYMTYYNEARANDGLTKLYSDETIYNYASGNNPYRYPNVDYYSSKYLKQASDRFDATAEISGGNDKARYYTNIGYQTSGALLNFGEAVKNGRSDRFNVRGNIDINVSKYITSTVDASAVFYTGGGVNTDYWGSASTLRPNRFSPLIPISMIEKADESSLLFVKNSNHIIDGKYMLGGTQLDPTNPFAAIYAGGYNKYTSRQFQFNTSVTADLRNVLQGLTFRSSLAVDYSTTYNLAYNNNYATYTPTWNNYAGNDLLSKLTQYGQDASSGVQNVSNTWYRQTIAVSGQFNYLNTFKNKHNISGVLLINGFQQSESAVYQKNNNLNLGLQLGYNFNRKYYADFSGAFIQSGKLPENNRQAFSPTFSLGWRLSKENFLVNSSIVDELKLTASAGIVNTDLDINNYYLYQGFYTGQGSWYGWKDGVGIQATESRRGDNPNMTFAKRKEINIGFDGSFFKGLIKMDGSIFVNKLSGNIIQASVLYPSYYSTGWPVSSFIPYINYNDDKRVGFDFSASINKRIATIDWKLGVTATYYKTTASKRAELYENSYQNRQGKPIDAIWGLKNLGFFNSQDDINNSPKQTFGQVKPGDVKYMDQNGDGIIDSRDEVYLGRGGWYGAPVTMGINVTAKWKNLTFFALGVGRFGAYGMKNSNYFWVDGEDKYSVLVRDRWTEATKNTAKFPRLTTFSSDNNYRSSDLWQYSTNRFDLGKVQISYDLTHLLNKKAFVREFSFYAVGSNLLTISPERETMELNIGGAPQTRFYNVGIKALF